MFGKIKKRLGAWHEKRLVKSLQGSGYFDKEKIQVEKKEIHLGQWGFVYVLMEPKYKFQVQMLVHWYGWKAMETRLVIRFLGKSFTA